MTLKTTKERKFYIEALDRDRDDEVVEYALSRSLSPTLIADYETKLIPKELLRKKLNEFYNLIEVAEWVEEENQIK